MTNCNIAAIRSIFAEAIGKDPARFARDFCLAAAARDPSLRAVLLPVEHGVGHRDASLIFGELDDPRHPDLASVARAMAKRVPMSGIKPRHYAALGRALLDTLAERTNGSFTDAARSTCADAFVIFAEARMASCYNTMDLVA